jgi:hypothetical protein
MTERTPALQKRIDSLARESWVTSRTGRLKISRRVKPSWRCVSGRMRRSNGPRIKAAVKERCAMTARPSLEQRLAANRGEYGVEAQFLLNGEL